MKPFYIASIVVTKNSGNDVDVENWVVPINAITKENAEGIAYGRAMQKYPDYKISTVIVTLIDQELIDKMA